MRRYLVMAAILACVSMSATVLGAEQTGGTTEESAAKPSPVTVRIEGTSAVSTSDAAEPTTEAASSTSNATLKFNPKKEEQ